MISHADVHDDNKFESLEINHGDATLYTRAHTRHPTPMASLPLLPSCHDIDIRRCLAPVLANHDVDKAVGSNVRT